MEQSRDYWADWRQRKQRQREWAQAHAIGNRWRCQQLDQAAKVYRQDRSIIPTRPITHKEGSQAVVQGQVSQSGHCEYCTSRRRRNAVIPASAGTKPGPTR